ncbi:OsmC family protein [Flavicella sediminum]|uniref:OsmC family protein n=1 Tax=Flavicella sediminum TaxID=2585141 RepID=UPI0011215FBC|nr:OsmC family protein [Flavicella sediminum]
MTHNVALNWKGKMHFESEGPGGKVLIDGAEEFGGEGKGVRPKAMMLSALAGCAGMDISSLLKKMRAEVAHFAIDVAGELTDEDPKFYKNVKVTFKFYDKEFNKKKIEKAVDLSVNRYCGVMEMFRQFANVTVAIEYIEE